MLVKKKILVINGSASERSSNEKLILNFISLTKDMFEVTVFDRLKTLPHFDPELSGNNPPDSIVAFRKMIQDADGIVICTPEYVFSIPSGLKNAIEWCIATTVFLAKPTGLITASASGEKAHEELMLIMKTATCHFTTDTTLLIQGIKGKINSDGLITDVNLQGALAKFVSSYKKMLDEIL